MPRQIAPDILMRSRAYDNYIGIFGGILTLRASGVHQSLRPEWVR